MDIEIKDRILEVVHKIKMWNPKEDCVETLLNLCNEFDEVKPNTDISLDDWIDITHLGCAAEYKERVDGRSNYPIWTCDSAGNCIVGEGKWYIENIDNIDRKGEEKEI
ncbi:MAG: hypothetical protein QG646_231 [Euryarchaeota archaeon]|jgi:hypothetical protein|nr:hypothetical protein [Euryarchaeota archaeon]